MNLVQAAVWVDVLDKNPDRCLIAADWFDEQGRDDIGLFLRNLAAEGNESGASRSLETIYFSRRAQARSAHARMMSRGIHSLLAEIRGLDVRPEESLTVVDTPFQTLGSRYVIPELHNQGFRFADAGDVHVESTFAHVVLERHKYGGQVTWRRVRQSWSVWVWAGRGESGRLYHTPFPGELDISFGEPIPLV